MPYPGLAQEDHKILGSEYCSGYTDLFGKWNTGFYCPQTGSTSAVFCCGTQYYKYCCTTRPNIDEEEDETTSSLLPYTVRVPVFFAIFCGVVAVLILLITAICFFCSCCFVYKKRRDAASTGLYRIQGSSSTTSALASIYSNHNSTSVVTTPLDTSDWTSSTQLPISSYIPYPFSQPTQSSSLSLSSYPSSSLLNTTTSSLMTTPCTNNNNHNPNSGTTSPAAFYYNSLTPHSLNNNNNVTNNNTQFTSLATLYQYHQAIQHQQQQLRGLPLSPPTYSSSTNSAVLSYQQQQLRAGAYLHRGISPETPRYAHSTIAPNPSPGLSPAASLNSFHQQHPMQAPFGFNDPSHTPLRQVQQNCLTLQSIGRHLEPTTPFSNIPLSTQSIPLAPSAAAVQPRVRNLVSGSQTQSRGFTPQQQQRLATVQSLISAYHTNTPGYSNGNNHTHNGIVNGPCSDTLEQHQGRNPVGGQLQPPPIARNVSLNSSDVQRLNQINLLVSAVLNQNRVNSNANGVIRSSGSYSGNGEDDDALRGNTLGNGENSCGESALPAFSTTATFTTPTTTRVTTTGSDCKNDMNISDVKPENRMGSISEEPESNSNTGSTTSTSNPYSVVEIIEVSTSGPEDSDGCSSIGGDDNDGGGTVTGNSKRNSCGTEFILSGGGGRDANKIPNSDQVLPPRVTSVPLMSSSSLSCEIEGKEPEDVLSPVCDQSDTFSLAISGIGTKTTEPTSTTIVYTNDMNVRTDFEQKESLPLGPDQFNLSSTVLLPKDINIHLDDPTVSEMEETTEKGVNEVEFLLEKRQEIIIESGGPEDKCINTA